MDSTHRNKNEVRIDDYIRFDFIFKLQIILRCKNCSSILGDTVRSDYHQFLYRHEYAVASISGYVRISRVLYGFDSSLH